MSTWADRLASLLAANRAALEQAKISGSTEDWQRVCETGKEVRDFFVVHQLAGSPRMDAECSGDSLHLKGETAIV